MKKRYKVAFDSVEENTHQVEEHQKAFLKETEFHARTLKALQDEVAALKRTLYDYLEWTMWDVLRDRKRVVE